MNFPNSVKSGIRNWVNFGGRASRSEYWWFFLFNVVAQNIFQNISAVLGSLVSIGLFIPVLSLQFRRLHDVGRSAIWLIWLYASIAACFGFIYQENQSIVNFDSEEYFNRGMQLSDLLFLSFGCAVLVNLVFWLKRSDPEMNQYGPPAPPMH